MVCAFVSSGVLEMSFGNVPLFFIELVCVAVGIAIATGGGLLALRADVDRPLQCIPVFTAAVLVFLGGMALLCWFSPIAAEVADKVDPNIRDTPKPSRPATTGDDSATASRTHVPRSIPC